VREDNLKAKLRLLLGLIFSGDNLIAAVCLSENCNMPHGMYRS